MTQDLMSQDYTPFVGTLNDRLPVIGHVKWDGFHYFTVVVRGEVRLEIIPIEIMPHFTMPSEAESLYRGSLLIIEKGGFRSARFELHIQDSALDVIAAAPQ